MFETEINVKFFEFHISFFWFSITILSYTLILPVAQLQTQQMITSHIKSQREYLLKIIVCWCSCDIQNWWKI